MEFKVNVLGTASALPTVDRYPSAQVVQLRGRLFLIDCGEAVQMQLRRYSFNITGIEHIYISHMHGDHVFGIFGLLSTMTMMGRTSDLKIFAPPRFSTLLSFFLANFVDKMTYRIEHVPLVDIRGPKVIYESRNFEVLAFPLNHRIPSFGFIFREKKPQKNVIKEMIEAKGLSLYEIARLKEGNDVLRDNGELLSCEELTYTPYEPRSYAYCSDTAPFPELPEWVRGVDLLYHEATFTSSLAEKAAETYHSTAEDAARCALEADAGRLLVGHYSSRYRSIDEFYEEARNVFPNVTAAREGDCIEIPLRRFSI